MMNTNDVYLIDHECGYQTEVRKSGKNYVGLIKKNGHIIKKSKESFSPTMLIMEHVKIVNDYIDKGVCDEK